MIVTVEELVAKTRIKSGLRNNQFLSDDEIAEIISDQYAALRDKLITRFAYWFKKTLTFTLPDDAIVGETNKISLGALAPDFEMAQGVNWVLNGTRTTIDVLPTFEARNAYTSNAWLVGPGPSWNGVTGLCYFIDGDELEILPKANATGTFELIYSPMYSRLMLPQTIAWDVEDLAVSDQLGFIRYLVSGDAHPPFNAGMIGGSITVTLESPNEAFGCVDAEITGPPDIADQDIIDTGAAWPGGSATPPITGSISITYQPADSIAVLPTALAQFQNYLVIAASIEIKNSRDQSSAALSIELDAIDKRIVGVSKQRTQGISQAPRWRYSGGWGPGGGGGGTGSY